MNPLSVSYKGTEGSGEAQMFGKSSFDPVKDSGKALDKVTSAKLKQRERLETKFGELADINLEGIDIDIEREFQNDKKMLLNKVSSLYKDGIDPFNPMNEDAYFEVRNLKSGLEKKVNISKNQEKINQSFLEVMRSDDFTKKYDAEQTIDNYKNWRQASVTERAKMNPSDVLVQTPESFDVNTYIKDNFKLLEELESSGTVSEINDEGITIKKSWNSRTPDALIAASKSFIDGSDKLRDAVKADFDKLSATERGKYNGLSDYFYQNHMKQYVKSDFKNEQSKKGGGSGGYGGSKITENFLDTRVKNITSIIKAFENNSNGFGNPSKEALQLLPALTEGNDSIVDASYDYLTGDHSKPVLIIKKRGSKMIEDAEGNESREIMTITVPLSDPGAFVQLNELFNENNDGVSNVVPLELLQQYTKEKGYETDFSNLYDPVNSIKRLSDGIKETTKQTGEKKKTDNKETNIKLTEGSPL